MKDESKKDRLNKYLALRLDISRREADDLIKNGFVSINGAKATLGERVSETDIVAVKDRMVSNEATLGYVLFNKPVGYVCSRRAQGANPTIYDILPASYHKYRPVGRLDKDSSGLLILTNDGDFAYQMTHPKFAKTKVYEVELNKGLEPLHQQMISDYGVQLEDGVSQLMLEKLEESERKNWQVTMKEGRNRQIRRTFKALGYTVTKLHRTHFGKYSLNKLKTGEHKQLEKI